MAISTCERVWCNVFICIHKFKLSIHAFMFIHCMAAIYLSPVHRFHIIITICICIWAVQQSIQHNERCSIRSWELLIFVTCGCILQSKPTEQIKSKMHTHTQHHCNMRPKLSFAYLKLKLIRIWIRNKIQEHNMLCKLHRWMNWMIFAWFHCARTENLVDVDISDFCFIFVSVNCISIRYRWSSLSLSGSQMPCICDKLQLRNKKQTPELGRTNTVRVWSTLNRNPMHLQCTHKHTDRNRVRQPIQIALGSQSVSNTMHFF